MYGNAAEWVADWYGPYSYDAGRNPTGPDSGSEKVVRGGSWKTQAGAMDSVRRDAYPPDHRSDRIGFRCAADVAR